MGLFREYDLRGIVGTELTEGMAEQLGRAYATYAAGHGVKAVSLGRDGRLSSPVLHKSLLKGLLAGGRACGADAQVRIRSMHVWRAALRRSSPRGYHTPNVPNPRNGVRPGCGLAVRMVSSPLPSGVVRS